MEYWMYVHCLPMSLHSQVVLSRVQLAHGQVGYGTTLTPAHARSACLSRLKLSGFGLLEIA
jgi:hypothetical protein